MEIMKLLSEYDNLIEFTLGILLIFIADFILNRSKSGKDVIPLVRVLFCTAFTYTVSIVRELIEFFADYYIPGFALREYNGISDGDMKTAEFFGGLIKDYQYPLADTMFDFIFMAVGCAVGGAVLFVIYSVKSRKTGKDKNDTKAEKISV